MVVFGALENKYPAICSNYDDLQDSGNTHSTQPGHDFQSLEVGGAYQAQDKLPE
jgi:hypothetical protein